MDRVTWVIAQADPTNGGGWGNILATYGPFAPFAALLIYLLNLLWKDNKEKEAEIKRLTETAMDKVLPLVLEGTRTLSDAVDAIKDARSTTADTAKLIPMMQNLQQALEELRDDLDAKRRPATPRRRAGT